jgi:predicted transcriptional regulator
MKQIEVSEKLGITQASVSQYISSTRGDDQELRELFPETHEYAREIARKIIEGEDIDLQLALLCDMCNKIRENSKFCGYHRDFIKLERCNVCYEPADVVK